MNVVYRINLRDPNTYFLARNFAVQNKDIIYVANAIATELQKFLTIVQGGASAVNSAANAAYYVRLNH